MRRLKQLTSLSVHSVTEARMHAIYTRTVPQIAPICQVGRTVPNLGGTIKIELISFPYGGPGARRK